MSKFEKNLKFWYNLYRLGKKAHGFSLKMSLAIWGLTIGAGVMCDMYNNKINKEKSNKNK